MRKSKKSKLLLIGYYGWKNTGDDAMLYGLLQLLLEIDNSTPIAVLSVDDVIIPLKAKEVVEFIKFSPYRLFIRFLQSSSIILGGGTHIFDYGIKRRAIIILSRLLFLVLVSKILGKKVYLLGIGLGPLSTIWGKSLARCICKFANKINVRDSVSYVLLKSWKMNNKSSIGFDISATLEASSEIVNNSISDVHNILGISVTPVFSIYYKDRYKDLQFINNLVIPINDWLQKSNNNELRLFIFKGKSKDDDISITQSLKDRLTCPEKVKVIQYDPDPTKTLAEVSLCTSFIGMRYHSCLFAYLNKLPLLIINYHSKCQSLASDIGLPKKAVIDLDNILNGQFDEHFNDFIVNYDKYKASLPIKVAREKARSIIGSLTI